MCNVSGVIFFAKHLSKEEIRGKRVIEVGARDVNGGCRPLIESWEPAEYIGVDIEEGPGVEVICKAEDLVERFGRESFDIVISTELLEHVRGWRDVISNIKNVCRPGGTILITTRSRGFSYHGYPFDFWRYEMHDMKHIFSDCDIPALEADPREPGVFAKVRKPHQFTESSLAGYELYSIVANRRVRNIADEDFRNWHFIRLVLAEKLSRNVTSKVGRFLFFWAR